MSTLKLNTTSGGSVNLVPDDTAANLIISPQTGYYLPAGTGAVATTVQAKLRESVSVFDFMTAAQIADVQAGTELVNVTTAIQAALDSVKIDSAAFDLQNESRGGTVHFPAGRYLVSAALMVRPGTCLVGDGANISVIVNSGTTNNVISVLDTQAGSVDPAVIENLAVVQKFGITHTAGNAINIVGGQFGGSDCGISPIVRGVRTQDTYGGLYFDWCFPGTIENVHAMRHTAFGFKTTANCTSITFQNCYAGACTAGSGFMIAGNYITLLSCASDSNALDGYEIYYDSGAATSISLIGCGTELCARNGIASDRVGSLAIITPRVLVSGSAQSCLKFDGGDAITVVSPVISATAANANPCINITNTSGAYPSNVQLMGFSGITTNYATLTNQPDYVFYPGNRSAIGMYSGTLRLGGIGSFNNALQIYQLGSNFPAGAAGSSYGENIVPVATAAFSLAASTRYKPVVNAPTLTLARLIAGAFVDTPTITSGTVTRAEGERISDITGGTANANLVLGNSAIPATLSYSICNTSTRENLMVGPIRWSSSTGPLATFGAGTPEGAVTAPVGSTYQRTDGGAGTSFYVKESGTGNTGWVAK